MTPERLQQLVAQFPTRRIAVLGDFFLDKYLETDPALTEPSLETGKPAYQVVAVRRSPGAAGTVVNNLAALGTGRLHAVGAIGDDGEGYDLVQGLERLGCTTDRLLRFAARVTPTYLKPRDATVPGLEGEHSRYDTKNRTRTPPEIEAALMDALAGVLPQVDALIVADQVETDDCGVVTAAVRDALARLARQFPQVIVWADSRTHIRRFRGAIIKPNQFEAVGNLNPRPGETVPPELLERTLMALRQASGAPVVITRGEQGMLVSDPAPTAVPGVRVPGPLDTTGAGDSATAGAVLALTAGAALAEAALVGNLVASITIQQLATTGTARPDELFDRLALWRAQQGQ